MGNLENDKRNLQRWSEIIEGKATPCHELTEEENAETSDASRVDATIPNTGRDVSRNDSDEKQPTPFERWLPMFREYCNRER